MNKRQYIVLGCALLIAIICAIIYGLSKKETYENPMEDFDGIKVCQFYNELSYLLDEETGMLDTFFNDSEYILKITPVTNYKIDFQTYSIDVKVEKIFKSNDDLKVGDTIKLSVEGYYFFEKDNTISMQFVNFMKYGNDYLVFVKDKLESELYDYPVYRTEAYSISPIFSYTDFENVIIEQKPDASNDDVSYRYVYYNDVKNNELFVESKELENKCREFKYRVISTVDDEYIIPKE